MKHILKKLLVVVIICSSSIVSGQVSQGGTPISFTKTHIADVVPVAVMPAVDVEALLAEDVIDKASNEPFRFGIDIDVDLSLDNAGKWSDLKGGDRVWRVGIKSDGAYSLNLIFSEFYMPEGASMFVYTADKEMVIGAFTSFNNKEHGKFSTTVLRGDEIVIEYFEPAEARGQGRLAVNKVIHGYRPTFFKNGGGNRDFGDSGGCNNNVACAVSAGWENEINASLMYLLSNNTRICSGAMLNNVQQDGTPYFLSADHCYDASWATWIFMFNYQSPDCAGTIDGPTSQTVSGSTLRARRGASDFMLFELSVSPPLFYNAYYAGWSNVDVPATSAVGIHHPANDVKMISFENDPLEHSGYFGAGTDHWEVTDWDDGTTEGGSSGSPLFDQNHRVVGQLHGGSAACGNNREDYYGKFSLSWDGGSSASSRLRDWLDPQNTGATVLDGLTLTVANFATDVSLESITGIDAIGCGTSADGVLRLFNNGSNLLTNVELTYFLDGASQGNFSWTGSLNFLQASTIAVPNLSGLSAGTHQLQVIVSSVNGTGADQNILNDTTSFNFEVVLGEQITIDLRTDNYSEETAISITDDNSNVVFQESSFLDNTLQTYTPCLACGCYTFTITDSENDGICCSYGNGSYSIELPDGSIAGTGGSFSSQETVQFCVEPTAAPVIAINAPDTAYVGDIVQLNGTGSACPNSWSWSAPGGDLTNRTSINAQVSYQSVGTYTVTLTGGNIIGVGNASHNIVVLPAVSVKEFNSLSVKLYPNPANSKLNLSFGNMGASLQGATVKLINTIGVEVMVLPVDGAADVQMNIVDLPAGLYLVEVVLTDGSSAKAQRFIKQ